MRPYKDELALIKLYVDLTGSSESLARCVFMYVCCAEDALDGVEHVTDVAMPALQPHEMMAKPQENESLRDLSRASLPENKIPLVREVLRSA